MIKEVLISRLMVLVFNLRNNHGWLFFLIGYIVGAFAMLHVLDEMGMIT